jgi:hypothetical protein
MFLDENKDKKDAVFDDLEAQSNLVDFYDLLLKIDKRTNPQNYIIANSQKYD